MPALQNGSRKAALWLVSLTAYVALEWISFIHEYKGLPVTPWNPGLGVVFGLIMARGAFYASVLFVGVIVSEVLVLQTRLAWPVVLGIASIIALATGGVADVCRRYLTFDPAISRLRDLAIVLFAGITAVAFIALLLPTLMVMDTKLDWADVNVATIPLVLGDLIGIAVLAPLTMRLIHLGDVPFHPAAAPRPEIALHAMLLGGSLALVHVIGFDQGARFFYILFLPVVITAIRFGLDGASVALAFTQFALVGLLHGAGIPAEAFTEFQLLMGVLTTTGLTVGAVVSERQNANIRARRAEARLRDLEAEAAQAARFHLVSGMTSALAHEINQPMTAARAFARSASHLVGREEPDLPRVRDNISKVVAQIDHAGEIVRRMRDFLRRGRLQFNTVHVRPMVEDALTLIRADAMQKHVSLSFEAPDDLPPVMGDRVQLQQVLLNLVRNAIDSISGERGRKGKVRVSARLIDGPDRIEFSVHDNGPGMTDDEAARLFDPLVSSKTHGLGLGLPICVSITEVHGGRVWLHSYEAGNTEFRFTVPLTPPRTDP